MVLAVGCPAALNGLAGVMGGEILISGRRRADAGFYAGTADGWASTLVTAAVYLHTGSMLARLVD